jgi:uncharacterized protein YbdZ (MbtH family)
MNLQAKTPQTDFMVVIECADRWQVYRRLQELGLSCRCGSYQALTVEITGTDAIVQVWSVVNRTKKSRSELIDWLDTCWRINDSRRG